ncbi:MAG TPA: hypothetical protein VNJ70_12460 [Thermoanaerobaculia bacterium]|nr:hypothetical protein [Thermoanaerobaculia bacterium]
MPNLVRVLAFAFLIIVGALMFTPDGIVCIACGLTLTRVLGVIAIVLGIAGFVVGRGAAVR